MTPDTPETDWPELCTELVDALARRIEIMDRLSYALDTNDDRPDPASKLVTRARAALNQSESTQEAP